MSQTLPTDEVKKRAFAMKAELTIYQLYQFAEAINLASTRGAFRGPEMSHVGSLFDNLTKGVDQAFKIARDQIATEAAKTETLAPIIEEPAAIPPVVPEPEPEPEPVEE